MSGEHRSATDPVFFLCAYFVDGVESGAVVGRKCKVDQLVEVLDRLGGVLDR